MSDGLICSVHGKIRHETRRAALRSGSLVRRTKGGQTFAYECSDCGGWHLSQQSKTARRKRSQRAAQHTGHRDQSK